MKHFIDYLKSKLKLSQKAEEYLVSISRKRIIEKGTTLIREGQYVNKLFFVVDGCLRSYCIDKKGKEHTLQFAIKNWWISDYIAIHTNEPAKLTVDCLKDSIIIEFKVDEIHKLSELFPAFEQFQKKNLENHLVNLQNRILNQLQLSASERYDTFLTQYPDIEQYTPNFCIASYLGITQESLSRIRVEKTKK